MSRPTDIGPALRLATGPARTAALASWLQRSGVDAVNALLLLQASGYPVDIGRARALGRTLEVDDELERLNRWNERLGGNRPSEREVEEWLEAGSESGAEP